MQNKTIPIKQQKLLHGTSKCVPLNCTKITVGTANKTDTVIREDPETGLKYQDHATDAVEIYNAAACKSNWIFIALETGAKPGRWFPGAEVHGKIPDVEVSVKAGPGNDYEQVGTVKNTDVVLTNIKYLNDSPENGWYHIKTTNFTGYIAKSQVYDLEYVSPNV